MTFTLLFTWLALAALTGVFAARKQRNFALWLALGFASGVLAFAVVAVLPSPEQTESGWATGALLRFAERLAA